MSGLALPVAAEELVPHRSPMRLIERLLEGDDGTGLAEAVITAASPLDGAAGTVEPLALVELLAQAYAAVRGYGDRLAGRPVQKGFLVGARKVELSGIARCDERLTIAVRTVASIEGFSVVEGEVRREDEVLAAGNLKLWLQPADGEEAS